MNEKIFSAPIGPEGVYGSFDLEMVGGKLAANLSLSPAGILNLIAAKIGGPIPAEVVAFIEKAAGLS